MAKNLVIVESPAKAKTIAKFLGDDFVVESCFGHIKDLPKSELGIDVENNFQPTYQIISGKGKVVSRLKKLSKEVESIFLATDLDREGEAISWHLSQELKHENFRRVIFNQITRQAIREAVNNPTKIDMNKVNAQQSRRVLDRLVGYKISPLLWKKVRRGLSAGRVQSVAVRLICQREQEIEKFVLREYWIVKIIFSSPKKEMIPARLSHINGKKAEIKNEKEARELAKELKQENYKVTKIEEKEKKKFPAPPFITSTLQQAANSQLRFSTSKTMKIAQGLYEGQNVGRGERVGLITYMRTDSVRLAKEAQLSAQKYIQKNLGKEYLPARIPLYKNRKTSQDAHEAIRPTDPRRTPKELKDTLSPDHYKLYQLIWRKFMASQMAPAILRTVKVVIEGGKYTFLGEGKEVIFPGFLKIYQEKKESKKVLPPLAEAVQLSIKEVISQQQFTPPPSRFSEAGLVKYLEEKGIGRPSTYAPTISTILRRGYIRWVRGQLIPTSLGRIVNDLLVANFSTLLNPEFTAQLEDDLDVIEQGEKKWTEVVKQFYGSFEMDLTRAEEKMKEIKKEGLGESSSLCEKCGGRMLIRFGRFGLFLACSNYPKCKFTQPLDQKIGVACPLPDCSGEIIEKVTAKGKIFYGCNHYPECRFISWEEPVKVVCPQCQNPYLVKDQRSQLKCPQCGHKFKETVEEKVKLNGLFHRIIKYRITPNESSS